MAIMLYTRLPSSHVVRSMVRMYLFWEGSAFTIARIRSVMLKMAAASRRSILLTVNRSRTSENAARASVSGLTDNVSSSALTRAFTHFLWLISRLGHSSSMPLATSCMQGSPKVSFTMARAKRTALAGPLAVMMLPSITTGVDSILAPPALHISSNPG